MGLYLIQDVFYLALLVVLSVPLELYIYRVMAGGRVLLSPVLAPVEGLIYRAMGIRGDEEMRAGRYAVSALSSRPRQGCPFSSS